MESEWIDGEERRRDGDIEREGERGRERERSGEEREI